MIMIISSLGLALLPAWLLIRYFVASDKYPEPTQLIKNFWQRVGTIIPVLVVAFPLGIFEAISGNLYQRALYKSSVATPVPEEFFKFCVLYYFCLKLRGFDEPMDGIVYGTTISLEFAALENISYSTGNIGIGLLRALTAVPGHADWGGIMGCLFAKAYFTGEGPGFLQGTFHPYPYCMDCMTVFCC